MKSLATKLGALLMTTILLAGISVATETAAKFKVTGMHCDACQAKIEKALKKTAGVRSVNVDWKQGSASIVYDDAKTSPEQITNIIQKQGYTADLQK